MAEKNLLTGPLFELVNNDDSFGSYVLNKLREQGNNAVQIDGITGVALTAAELLDQSVKLAVILKSFGITSGDVIGISSENRSEFIVVSIAALYLGASFAPFNVTYTESELLHTLNYSKPQLIFCSPLSLERVFKVTKQSSFVKKIFEFAEKSSIPEVQTFFSLLNDHTINTKGFKPTAVDLKTHTAAILCSSGTTGLPKGVELTHLNFLVTVEIYRNYERIRIAKPVFLTLLPLFHALGLIRYFVCLCNNTKQILIPKFEEHLFLRCIQNYKVTSVSMVPPLLVFLSKSPLVDQYDLSSVKEIACGAGPISKELDLAVSKRLKNATVFQGYGMTETSIGIVMTKLGNNVRGSVGVLVPGMQGKVIDLETGATLGPNQRGELCFRGLQIMKGYIGDEASTKATIDSENWLHTGDIGYYDENENWFIVDRLKELIKYKGYQVPPAELEAILLTHKAIKDVAVVGLPHEASGELPLAFVVKQVNSKVTAREIQSFLAAKVSPAKRLHGGVRFIDQIPKNPSGKILRRQLREFLKTKSKL